MSGLPYRSKLAPFESEIVQLRRQRPPVPYRQIVELLKERHGVAVTINAVFVFLKTRRKWDHRAAAATRTTTSMAISTPPARSRPPVTLPSITHPVHHNHQETARPKLFSFAFSDRYNLTRLTPEEATALEKKLDDELKGES